MLKDDQLNEGALFECLKQLSDSKKFWIAFSGGVDSLVLLQLCSLAFKNKPEFQVSVLHINHGLSEHADQWAKHCAAQCQSLNFPFSTIKVNARPDQDESPEEAARRARYQAFEQFLEAGDCVLLAHHAEDQAETILLRLFRGAGPLGLGGMQAISQFGKAKIVRPLLTVSKEKILEYAKAHGLNWIEDESNLNQKFDRNFLRQNIIPQLKTRWPKLVSAVNRAASLCFETASLAQKLASEDFVLLQKKAQQEKNKKEKRPLYENTELNLSVSGLLKLPETRRRAVIRHWLQAQQLPLPSLDHMERIDREILQARIDAEPRLKIGEYEIYRVKGELKVKDLVNNLNV